MENLQANVEPKDCIFEAFKKARQCFGVETLSIFKIAMTDATF